MFIFLTQIYFQAGYQSKICILRLKTDAMRILAHAAISNYLHTLSKAVYLDHACLFQTNGHSALDADPRLRELSRVQNMDIQKFVLEEYSCATYINKTISK